MSNPVLARSDADGRRFYPWKDQNYWSVTTLISMGVPKYAIAPWSAKVVAELVASDIHSHGAHARAHAAIRRWAKLGRAEVIRRQAEGGLKSIKLEKLTDLDLALRYLKGQPDRIRDAAAEVGTAVHSEAEAAVLANVTRANEALAEHTVLQPWPEALAGYEASFNAWRADWNPEYIAAEATVFNRPQAYAGTLDAIVRVRVFDLIAALVRVDRPIPDWLGGAGSDVVTLVIDNKSGNEIHPEVGMQLAAYARAEFIGMPDGHTELPVPHIDGGLALHITPKGYRLRLVDIGDPVFDAFRFAREIARYAMEVAPTILSPNLAPGAKPRRRLVAA
jgi:hypothetical protein